MAGARLTPSRARRAVAPDEGRCRADPHCTHRRPVAVLVFPVLLFALFISSSPAASAQVRHEAGSPSPAGPDRHATDVVRPGAEGRRSWRPSTTPSPRRRRRTTSRRSTSSRRWRHNRQLPRLPSRPRRQQRPQPSPRTQPRRSRSLLPRRWWLRCHEHQHARLGVHPPARVRRQLRRGRRRCLPVRARHVGRPDRSEHAGRGLPSCRAGRCCAQVVLGARLGALDHSLRVRTVRSDP